MGDDLYRLLNNNRQWVRECLDADPEYFRRSARSQTPEFLFIGCSDSRVPANEITGTQPGEMFVHRNIANQVFPNDINMLSVLQYAVEVLDVKHVIVCGHYECGGVKAAAQKGVHYGLVDNWLSEIRTIERLHGRELEAMTDQTARLNRLGELNVIQQVYNLTLTPVVRQAWERGRRPQLHGLIYSLENGLLKELVREVDTPEAADRLLPML
jgi:carbonic anhydrase